MPTTKPVMTGAAIPIRLLVKLTMPPIVPVPPRGAIANDRGTHRRGGCETGQSDGDPGDGPHRICGADSTEDGKAQ